MYTHMRQCHSAFVTAITLLQILCFGPIPDHKGAFVLGGCCVFVCGSTGLLFVEAVLDYHCRERQLGMCPGSVGSGLARCQTHRWPESQSLFFLLFCSLTNSLPLFLSFSSAPSPSLADEDISSCKQRPKSRVEDATGSRKNMSLCGPGMFMMGCKYATEEALKTATTLKQMGSFYLEQCLYCFYCNACWLLVDSFLKLSWKMLVHSAGFSGVKAKHSLRLDWCRMKGAVIRDKE